MVDCSDWFKLGCIWLIAMIGFGLGCTWLVLMIFLIFAWDVVCMLGVVRVQVQGWKMGKLYSNLHIYIYTCILYIHIYIHMYIYICISY